MLSKGDRSSPWLLTDDAGVMVLDACALDRGGTGGEGARGAEERRGGGGGGTFLGVADVSTVAAGRMGSLGACLSQERENEVSEKV